jgi:hypothetical protein
MKKIKIILGVLVVLAGLLVVAVLIAGAHLGDMVKKAMEVAGPKVTQTTLTVEGVNVSLLGGSAGVKGLVLGNPEGYQAPQSLSLSNAAVSLVPGSVLSDKVVIRSVEVHGLEVTFEGNPFGANNLTKIMANVEGTKPASGAAANQPAANQPAANQPAANQPAANQPAANQPAANQPAANQPAANQPAANQPAASAPVTPSKPGKKLQVDSFVIIGAKIHANLTGVLNRQITLSLPDIQLTGLGQGPEGITARDLTKKVLQEITTGTLKAVVADAGDLGKNAADAAKSAAQDVLKNGANPADAAKKLKQGLNGLLGK